MALEEGTEERTNEHSLDIWACRKLRQSSCLSRVTNHPGLRGPASFNTKSSTNREIPQSGQTEKLTTLHLALGDVEGMLRVRLIQRVGPV